MFLAIQSRNFPAALNESKQVALSLYVTLIVLIIFAVLGFSLSSFPLVTFILFAAAILICYFAVTIILFIGTIIRILSGKEPKQVTSAGTTRETAQTRATAVTSSGTSIDAGSSSPQVFSPPHLSFPPQVLAQETPDSSGRTRRQGWR